VSSWFAQPEPERLELSDGQWIMVRKTLNHGEQRAALARISLQLPDGGLAVNRLAVSDETVISYLLDWSLCDLQGQPVVIRNASADVVQARLDALDPDRFEEIKDAIDRHVEAVAKARSPFGATTSDKTLASVA
jgi:hypothetical protein